MLLQRRRNSLGMILIFLCSLPILAKDFRPTGKMKMNKVEKTCSSWAKNSQARGVNKLIIVFEGLSSFSQSYANKTYARYESSLKGVNQGAKIKKAPMNFIMKNLIAPNMGQIVKDSELLLLSEKTQRKKSASVASTCAKAWHKAYKNELEIIIIGHSFGGYSAINLSQRLEEMNISVATVFTMDARTYPQKYKEFWTPNNVELHINHFQKGAWMPGYRVKGAENKKFDTSHSGITSIEESNRAFQEIL